MARRKKTKIKLNDVESLSHLMQETYNDACGQQLDAQRAINEMVNAAEPDGDVDDLTKLAREKGNLLKIKDSAIKIKLELSKLKTDILKQSGVVEGTEKISGDGPKLTDFKKVREMLKNKDKTDDTDEYIL